jgi:TonB family protein
MDRLQKKCLIASGLTHGFLLLLLVVGSAFFIGQPQRKDLPTVNVVPRKLIDAAFAGGGGNPRLAPSDAKQRGNALTPQPPQPIPPSRVTPQTRPQVQRPSERQTASEPKRVEPAAQNSKPAVKAAKLTPAKTQSSNQKPALDLKPWVRTDTEKAKGQTEAEARRLADASRRLERAIGGASKKLEEGFLNGTAVEVPGPGGEAYANYAAFVREAYDNAWIISQALAQENATAMVKVTIRRDGRVIGARIIRRSGNSALDRSVQQALDRVKFIAPFPDGARDDQREFTIDFSLKAKRALG